MAGYYYDAEGKAHDAEWAQICRELGVDVKLLRVHFLESKEARHEFGISSWGAVNYGGQGEQPEVVVVLPYTVGKSGFYLDRVELRDTCYHALICLLLRDEIEEEAVHKMANTLNHRQKGWHFCCAYLRESAIALGLGPPGLCCFGPR